MPDAFALSEPRQGGEIRHFQSIEFITDFLSGGCWASVKEVVRTMYKLVVFHAFLNAFECIADVFKVSKEVVT